MKTTLILSFVLLTASAFSQTLPRKSSKCNIEQVVGLNQIDLTYSRPNANGRVIFGDVVPYGEVWRLGANAPTVISLEHPITVNNQKLDTGSYAIFAIPSKNSWNVVFNTDTKQWGAYDYDPKKNVLEYSVATSNCNHTESFTIEFKNVEESSAVISMRWANVEVSVPFSTDTDAVVAANIKKAIDKKEDLAKVYYRAADYFFERGQMEKAEEQLANSIKEELTYYNTFLQAQMMHKEGKPIAWQKGEEAALLAEKAEKQGWADYIREEVGKW